MLLNWMRLRIVMMSDAGGAGGGGTVATGGGTAAAGGAGGSASSGAGTGSGAASPAPAFAETLPEDIRGEAAFRDIKDLSGLAKSYLNATKLVGGRPEDLIKVPAPDDAAAWDAAWGKLGRPEKPDGYQFTAPKLPEGLAVNEQLQGNFAAEAHKLGLSAKQAAGLYDWWHGTMAAQHTSTMTAAAQAEATALDGLKTEWGAAYDQNVQLARAALAHYGDDAFSKYLDTSRLGNHPAMLRIMQKLGVQLAEDGLIGKDGDGNGSALSPAEAQQQINALRGDAEFRKVYMDRAAPGHKDAVARMQALHAMAYPPRT